MDIKEASFSHYKTDKPSSPSASSESNAPAGARPREVSNLSIPNDKPYELKEGTMLRGQVIDHRFNEVRIILEPWNQEVSAKLATEVPLSIGETANFQVTKDLSDSLVLKYIPEASTLSSDNMIQKALEASKLPFNEHNKAIVQELINHGMPIDKQTLQTLIRLSYKNNDASALTLVLMLKNNLPLTPENIRQFEAYQNGTHQLLNDIRTIAGMLTKLITQPKDSSSASALFTTPSMNTNPSVNLTDPVLTRQEVLPDDMPRAAKATPMVLPASTEEAASPSAAAQPQAASNQPINKLLQINSRLLGVLTANEAADVMTTATTEADTTAGSTSGAPQDLSHPASSLSQQPQISSEQLMNSNLSVLSGLLNTAERTSLLGFMNSFPDTAGIKEQLQSGTAQLTNLLNYIQNNLTSASADVAGRLLGSPEYMKLLEKAFLLKWTITPDKLSKKAHITGLYQNLQTDMEELARLIKAKADDSETSELQRSVKNLQENLHFMKDLNEAFTYIQLPVSLRDKQLHTDLYVMTRKKSLREASGTISVLLHLDMDYLGPLNVYLSLYEHSIKAKFYMADKEAEQLVKANLLSLTQALSVKGFLLSSEVTCSVKQPDFSRDFIEENTGDGIVKRYSFDIRT